MPLTVLDISNNAIGDEGAAALAVSLRGNSSLQTLAFSHNLTSDRGTALIVSGCWLPSEGCGSSNTAAPQPRSVRHLAMSQCGAGSSTAQRLRAALCRADCPATNLDLSNNAFGRSVDSAEHRRVSCNRRHNPQPM